MAQPRWATLLAWLVVVVAVFVPVGYLAAGALWPRNGGGGASLAEVLLAPGTWGLLANSVGLAAGATGLAVAVGLPYALLCVKSDMPGRPFFRIAYLMPLLIPPYMHAIVWGRLLAADGPVNRFLLQGFGLTDPPLNGYGLPGAVFVLGMAYFPFVTLLTIGGLEGLDPGTEEAALLQHGPWRTLTRIGLPLVTPQVLAGATFVFVFSVIEFSVPDILRVRVFPIEIFAQFSAFYDERAAVILGLPLLLVAAALIALQVRVMRGKSYVSYRPAAGMPRLYRLARWRGAALGFGTLVVGLSMVVPLAWLIRASASLETYRRAVASSAAQIVFSVEAAAVAAALMTAVAFLVSHSMVRGSRRTRTLLEYVTQLPFAVAPIVLAIGMIRVWNRPATDWLYTSAFIIVLGYVAHFIPFTVRAVLSGLDQLDARFEEAGWLLCRNRLRVTGHITLPLLRDALLGGFLISFVLAMGEMGVTLLVVPPGMATIPIKIYNYMHYGADATVAALCVTLVLIQLVICLALHWLWRRPRAAAA